MLSAACLCCRASKGHITKDDLAEGLRLNSPSAFEALHSSGSLAAELAEEFKALDANGDGVVTLEEFKAALSLPTSIPMNDPRMTSVLSQMAH